MAMIYERIGKLLEVIKELIYQASFPIDSYKMILSKEDYKDINNLDSTFWKIISNNRIWGGNLSYFWFDTEVTVPAEADGKCLAYNLLTGREREWDALNPQFTVYINGIRRQGFDTNHHEIILSDTAQAGEKYRITLSAFTGDDNFHLQLNSSLKIIDKATENYCYDLAVPFQVLQLLDTDSNEYIDTLKILNDSLNLLDLRKPYSKEYYSSLEKAQELVTERLYNNLCKESKEKIWCVGHTHIDIAWLWTLAVTKDKAVRSFSTVLELMNRYPEYKFTSSQPQLYKYVKENAPDIYEKIKERIKEGRWETEGGMFVEADCNLSSGESLIRQFLFGKEFFRKEFGTNSEILWLPDVFGYSAVLPQIMKKCGIKYFMTTKISWNEFNKVPYDTFNWEGIDGTKVLTHFIPTRDYSVKNTVFQGKKRPPHYTTYNGILCPSHVKGAWTRYSQKDLNKEALLCFGYGDGGGGPTPEMLENYKRLSKGIPGCPQTVMSTARDFFKQLETSVKNNEKLPEWVGELYLEYHRGTYTSMARNKRNNRRAEETVTSCELFSTINEIETGYAYPSVQIAKIWEKILRNQFHGILPGTSIQAVYEDCDKEYSQIFSSCFDLQSYFYRSLTAKAKGNIDDVVVFNPNGEVSCIPVKLDKHFDFLEAEGILYPVQQAYDGSWFFLPTRLPQKGYKVFRKTKGITLPSKLLSPTLLENDTISIKFNEKGQFTSVFDKLNGRELLKTGKAGNILMTYEDRPHNYDAWDINDYYTEKNWEVSELLESKVVEQGPLRWTVENLYRYQDSTIKQYVSLLASSPEIFIHYEIDWKENHVLLKVFFPFDVHTDEATFEIQYGNVKRKTHKNTSWDYARFEVCMHKWMDISEGNYGISILNDSKYGCSVSGTDVGVSLLKSATYPNEIADQEHHSFTISLLPHKGSWKEAGTINHGYALNNTPVAITKEEKTLIGKDSFSFVSADKSNIVIEAIKKAEDNKGYIIRFFETNNCRTTGELLFAYPLKKVWECNMLEEAEKPIDINGNKCSYKIRPYEIKTFRVDFS